MSGDGTAQGARGESTSEATTNAHAGHRRSVLANAAVAVGVFSAVGPLLHIIYWNSPCTLPCGFLAFGVLIWPVGILLSAIVLILGWRRGQLACIRVRAAVGLIGSLIGLCWLIMFVRSHETQYGPWGDLRQRDVRCCLERTRDAAMEYAQSHRGEFPPTPATLTESVTQPYGGLLGGRMNSGRTVTDWHYVQELNTSSPPNWIVFYADSSLFNNEGGAILTVDGTVRLLDEPEFSAALDEFLREYKTSRRQPARILPPE